MKRIRILGMALVAVFAVSAMAVAIASAALPEYSPATNKGTSKSSTKPKFTEEGNIFAVECTAGEGSNTITGAKAGTFTETFTGCSAPIIGKCTGEGIETKGEIQVKGSDELVFIKGTEAGLAFHTEEVKFACGSEKLKVTGCALSKIEPVNTKTTKFTAPLSQSSGKESPDEYLNEAGEKVSCTLKSSKNGGTAKEGGQEQHEEITEESEGEIKT